MLIFSVYVGGGENVEKEKKWIYFFMSTFVGKNYSKTIAS